MLVVFDKNTFHIKATFSDDQKIEVIYRNSLQVLSKLDGIYMDDAIVPKNDIANYKLISGEIIKIPVEEMPQPIENPLMKQVSTLQMENAFLYLALAEMSILSAQQEQQNIETQNAIAELSMIVAMGGV